MHTYVIALDQGTTSSRAVLFDENARIVAMNQAMSLSRFIRSPAGLSMIRQPSSIRRSMRCVKSWFAFPALNAWTALRRSA